MRTTDAWGRFTTQLSKEPRVTWLGLLGLALGTLCAAIGLARGFVVPPEGNLWETATFDGAVGIFLVTQAALAPEAGFTPRGQRRWGTWLIVTVLYAYGIETVQAFRGLDPRFSAVAGATDQMLGGLFLLDALLIMVLFLVLGWRFFRAESTPLRLAVRYAVATCAVAFGVGIWMSVVTQGRQIGAEGNLMLIHGAGFHGLQAVPLVAVLMAWGGVPSPRARRWVHVAGVAWIGVSLGVLWQAAAGRPPAEPSPALLTSLSFLGLWALVAIRALATARSAPL